MVWKWKEGGKKVENQDKKTSNFFLFRRFYLEGWNATNKSCLFYAKFFEFEEFSIESFFCSSIQPQHAVSPRLCSTLLAVFGPNTCCNYNNYIFEWKLVKMRFSEYRLLQASIFDTVFKCKEALLYTPTFYHFAFYNLNGKNREKLFVWYSIKQIKMCWRISNGILAK